MSRRAPGTFTIHDNSLLDRLPEFSPTAVLAALYISQRDNLSRCVHDWEVQGYTGRSADQVKRALAELLAAGIIVRLDKRTFALANGRANASTDARTNASKNAVPTTQESRPAREIETPKEVEGFKKEVSSLTLLPPVPQEAAWRSADEVIKPDQMDYRERSRWQGCMSDRDARPAAQALRAAGLWPLFVKIADTGRGTPANAAQWATDLAADLLEHGPDRVREALKITNGTTLKAPGSWWNFYRRALANAPKAAPEGRPASRAGVTGPGEYATPTGQRVTVEEIYDGAAVLTTGDYVVLDRTTGWQPLGTTA